MTDIETSVFDVRDPDGADYVSAADAEAHVRATLDRPDQVHVIAPEILRALLDEIRGLRLPMEPAPPHGQLPNAAPPLGVAAQAVPGTAGEGQGGGPVGAMTTTATGYADAQGRPVDGQVTLTPITGAAGCPVGECIHPGTSHEPDEYAADGTPVRPICCAGDCRCGQQWRNA